jgi:hypothetical protein
MRDGAHTWPKGVRRTTIVAAMLDRLKQTLRRLRGSFSDKAEDAYAERDAAPSTSHAESFADGKAHAYGEASDDVRKAESDE